MTDVIKNLSDIGITIEPSSDDYSGVFDSKFLLGIHVDANEEIPELPLVLGASEYAKIAQLTYIKSLAILSTRYGSLDNFEACVSARMIISNSLVGIDVAVIATGLSNLIHATFKQDKRPYIQMMSSSAIESNSILSMDTEHLRART